MTEMTVPCNHDKPSASALGLSRLRSWRKLHLVEAGYLELAAFKGLDYRILADSRTLLELDRGVLLAHIHGNSIDPLQL